MFVTLILFFTGYALSSNNMSNRANGREKVRDVLLKLESECVDFRERLDNFFLMACNGVGNVKDIMHQVYHIVSRIQAHILYYILETSSHPSRINSTNTNERQQSIIRTNNPGSRAIQSRDKGYLTTTHPTKATNFSDLISSCIDLHGKHSLRFASRGGGANMSTEEFLGRLDCASYQDQRQHYVIVGVSILLIVSMITVFFTFRRYAKAERHDHNPQDDMECVFPIVSSFDNNEPE